MGWFSREKLNGTKKVGIDTVDNRFSEPNQRSNAPKCAFNAHN